MLGERKERLQCSHKKGNQRRPLQKDVSLAEQGEGLNCTRKSIPGKENSK